MHANLVLIKVSARYCKSTQEHARSGQRDSQVDQSFQLASQYLLLRLHRALIIFWHNFWIDLYYRENKAYMKM